MSVFNSVGTPLVILMVILLVAGAIFGTAISGSGYLNPATSNAQAVQMNAETVHQQAVFTQEERLAQAQTNAQIQTIDRQQKATEQQIVMNLNYEQQGNEKRLILYEKLMNVLINILWVIGIAAGLVLVLVVGLSLGSKAIVTIHASKKTRNSVDTTNTQSPVPSIDIWQMPEFREQMIKNARNNEAAIRQAMLNYGAQPLHNPAAISKEEWKKLPWAE